MRTERLRAIAILLLSAALVLPACSGGGQGAGADGYATVSVGIRALAASSAGLRPRAADPGVTRVTLTVSASDMAPVVVNLPLDGTVIEIRVPAGRDRLFSADAYEGTVRTHAGTTLVAMLASGVRTRVTITLNPLGGDTTPPTILSTSPADGATGVAVTTTVRVTFSEAMNGGSVTGSISVRAGGTDVTGSVAYVDNTATFTPSAALAAGTLHTVTVRGGATGVRDLAGNALAADNTFTFTTEPAAPPLGLGLWAATDPAAAPTARRYHSAVWAGVVPGVWSTPRMVVWGGTTDPAASAVVVSNGGIYDPAADGWTATGPYTELGPRMMHHAVWLQNSADGVPALAVWGGMGPGEWLPNFGFLYRFDFPFWRTMTWLYGSCPPRIRHSTVWTGSEMIAWGGVSQTIPAVLYQDNGVRYTVASDSFTLFGRFGTVGTAQPSRNEHTAVWTGSEMIAWGGRLADTLTDTGDRYNPVADSWAALSTTGAPSARTGHTAVWADNSYLGVPVMIVWGGEDAAGVLGDGAMYDPVSNTWTALPASGAPAARSGHVAVWTGRYMLVWGGNGSGGVLGSGAGYDPQTNSWFTMTMTDAPAARADHTAVWTGTQLIVWGGYDGSQLLNTGGRYTPPP